MQASVELAKAKTNSVVNGKEIKVSEVRDRSQEDLRSVYIKNLDAGCTADDIKVAPRIFHRALTHQSTLTLLVRPAEGVRQLRANRIGHHRRRQGHRGAKRLRLCRISERGLTPLLSRIMTIATCPSVSLQRPRACLHHLRHISAFACPRVPDIPLARAPIPTHP